MSNVISEETKTYIDNLKKVICNILVGIGYDWLSSLYYQLYSFETIRIMKNKILILMNPIECNWPTTSFKKRIIKQKYKFFSAFVIFPFQKWVFENSIIILIKGASSDFNEIYKEREYKI